MTIAKDDVELGEEDAVATLATASVQLILDLQDITGAYPASPTFSAYLGYCWFRDGAFIADAMSAAGAKDSAEQFFDWCGRILVDRRSDVEHIVDEARAGRPVPDGEMLPARFTFDGGAGDDDWWDFQLDGFGTWLWALVAHSRRHTVNLSRWEQAVGITVDYLTSSWDRPCFDWWEEHDDQVHVSTLACIAAGLDAVAESGILEGDRLLRAVAASRSIRETILKRGVTDGHLAKWLGSTEVDASALAAIAPLNVFPASSNVGSRTLDAVNDALTVDGGTHRYLADTFFGGGQWPLLSCFLGLGFAARGEQDRALGQLIWAAATADPAGALPEQIGDHLLDPTRTQEWVQRWGPVAQPLLWSHAMFVRLAVEIGVLEVSPT